MITVSPIPMTPNNVCSAMVTVVADRVTNVPIPAIDQKWLLIAQHRSATTFAAKRSRTAARRAPLRPGARTPRKVAGRALRDPLRYRARNR